MALFVIAIIPGQKNDVKMVLNNFSEDEEFDNLFGHAREYDQGLGKIRRGASSFVVATDGSGDFDDITSAVKALPSTGGQIFIKEGTYKVAATIPITKNNVSITGVGRGSIIDVEASTGFRINGPDYVTFSNLRIKCDEERTYALWFTNSTGSAVFNIWIDGAFASGIYVTGTNSKFNINNNFITDTLEASISVDDTNQIMIQNNSLDNGINIEASRFIIDGNVIKNQGDGNDGIAITGSDGVISNNFIEDDSTGDGGITTFADASNNVITGNRIKGFSKGVYIKFGSCDRNLIGHNILINNTTPISDSGTNTTSSNNITT